MTVNYGYQQAAGQ